MYKSWMREALAAAGKKRRKILRRPVKRPQAMKAGMRGRKMFVTRLKKSFTGVAFRARRVSRRVCPSPIVGEGETGVADDVAATGDDD